MVLNDNEIRNRVKNHTDYDMTQPLISPFEEKQLQGASYDVTLDKEIVLIKPINTIIDIRDQSLINHTYEKITIGDNGFIVMPHNYVLATLVETLYVPSELTAHIRPKTRFVRLGLYISRQHINPDSICKLNLGIFNFTNNPIRIYAKMSIAQIVFETMCDKPSKEKLYKTKKDSHYANDIEFVGADFSDEFNTFIDREIERLLSIT